MIQAINGATGDLVWEYQRQLPEDVTKIFPVPSINRNIAIYGNHIIDTSADDFVYALDAQTGKLDWENRIVDYRENSAQETSGPLIAAGKIVSGRGCEPKGGPDACIITAHDAKTGKEVWRVHTIPKPGEPGNESWGDIPYEQRKHVGTWMVPSYDPELQPDLYRHVRYFARARNSCSLETTKSTCITTARWLSTPRPARSSGITSTSSITGISTIHSSGT